MSTSKSIPIRLSEETAARLKNAEEKLHVDNQSLLIKLCLEAFLRAFEDEGEVVLPLNWREIACSLDSRRKPKLSMVAENAGKEAKAPSLGKVTYGNPRRMKKG